MSDVAVQPVRRGWRTVQRYVYVRRPYDDVWVWLGGHLSSLGEPMPGGGRSVRLRIQPAGREISRPVRLRVHGLICRGPRAQAAIDWTDADRPRWFPRLKGVLEVAPVPNDEGPCTQIGVVARYQPPFGRLGAVGDRLVGAEVTEASLATFLDELAATVEAAIPAPGRSAPKPPAPKAGRADRDRPHHFLAVDGLATRPGGAAGLADALAGLPGVTGVSIDPTAGLVEVAHDTSCGLDQIIEAAEL